MWFFSFHIHFNQRICDINVFKVNRFDLKSTNITNQHHLKLTPYLYKCISNAFLTLYIALSALLLRSNNWITALQLYHTVYKMTHEKSGREYQELRVTAARRDGKASFDFGCRRIVSVRLLCSASEVRHYRFQNKSINRKCSIKGISPAGWAAFVCLMVTCLPFSLI